MSEQTLGEYLGTPPQYFDLLKKPTKYYGTLKSKFLQSTGGTVRLHWRIKAEPHIILVIKRLFYGTRFDAKGVAFIPHNERIIGDLNWFMMRYPLKILSPDDWKDAYERGMYYVLEREAINKKKSIVQPASDFQGKLLDFQKSGLAFIKHNKKCLLADEMGLGKTVQALALLNKIKSYPALIVVPPHLLGQWKREAKRFLGEDIEIHTIKGLTPYVLPKAHIYLIHYLVFRTWYHDLIDQNINVFVFDECQELRRAESQKYFSIQQTIQQSKPEYCIGLSGTPIYNYGAEIFNVMNILNEGSLGYLPYFLKEWGMDHNRRVIEHPEKLGAMMKDQGLIMRRRKEDVLTELPPKRRMLQVIDLDDSLYFKGMKKSRELVKRIAIVEDKDKTVLMLEAVNNARRISGIAKAQHVAEFVKPILESEQPVLLYGFHHDVMDLYAKYLEEHNPQFITGRQTTKQKEENVKYFMDGQTNLLCINLRTTAGLNLQRARCVIFGELDYSPAVHTQAEDRAHRIGVKDSVLAYYLVAETPSDIEIVNCLDLKKTQFQGLMHDKPESKEDVTSSQREASTFMWNIVERVRKGDVTIDVEESLSYIQ